MNIDLISTLLVSIVAYPMLIISFNRLAKLDSSYRYANRIGFYLMGLFISLIPCVNAFVVMISTWALLEPRRTKDVTIDYKNPEPKDYEGKKLNPFTQDENGQFDPTPIETSLDWTEFKERNPELFQVTLAGSVLNGILFHEENNAVIHYTLEGNTPPNGDYIVTGTLNGKILNVTSFKSVEII